jgi:hypothetical protein
LGIGILICGQAAGGYEFWSAPSGSLWFSVKQASIIASSRFGTPCFSVYAPYAVGNLVGVPFPLSRGEYDTLRCSRKASAGALKAPTLARRELLMWATAVRSWATRFEHVISGEDSV